MRPIAWISAEVSDVVEGKPHDKAPSDDDGVETSVLGLITYVDGVTEAELLGYVHPPRQQHRLARRPVT